MGTTQVHIPLSPLDHDKPRAYYNGAYYFRLASGVGAAEAFKILHEGLHRTFVRVPWLSGKLYPQSPDAPGWRPGQVEIRHNPVDINGPWPYQLHFNKLNSPTSYDELKDSGFPTDAFEDQDLVWSPFLADINSSPEVFVAQANFIPGACILTAALHHAAGDQTGCIHILKVWSDNCNALQMQSKQLVDLPPVTSERNLLDQLWAKEGTVKDVDAIDPQIWLLVGLDPADVREDPLKASDVQTNDKAKAAAGQRILRSAVFYISPSNFTTVQTACAKECGGASLVSGNDAVCALIWRSFMRARSTARKAVGASSNRALVDADARLHMIFDGRPNFASGVPSTYLGNVTVDIQTCLPLSLLTSPDSSIATIAATIRSGVGSVDSANLLDMYTLLKNAPDFDHLARWKKIRQSSVDGNNMLISSMIMFPLASICFGDGIFGNMGVPEAARPLMGGFNRSTRICLVLPRSRNGSVEFVANLFDEELEVLLEDEEFGRYAMCL